MTAPLDSLRANNFDLLRFMAASQVAMVHVDEHLAVGIPSSVMYVLSIFPGVPIFFVISGFLISASFERATSLRAYAVNRILRIYPALWVCLGIAILSAQSIYSLSERAGAGMIPWLLAQVTIVQFFNPDFLRGYGVGVLNGSLWTIPVELQFYALLPLIYLFFNRHRWNRWLVSGVFVLAVVVNQYYTSLDTERDLPSKLFGVTVLPWFYMFLIGVLLQRYRGAVLPYLVGRFHWWLLAHVAACLLLERVGARVGGNHLNPISAISLALCAASFAYTGVQTLSRLLGGNDISYGVYIYHMVMINVVVQLGLARDPVYATLAILATLVAATLSWRYIEAPALRLKSYSIRQIRSA
jgi:peptidoglycan/LPS O-acetylase OafA/YrhL